MSQALATFIERALKELSAIKTYTEYEAWMRRIHGGLSRLDPNLDQNLQDARARLFSFSWEQALEYQRGLLEAVLLDLSTQPLASPSQAAGASPSVAHSSSAVFVVHGHDQAAKESVARFVTNLGLSPIILHEQASGSKTVIEKLEAYSSVAFAIVLLTRDDVGGLAGEDVKLTPRARQNVILELGYFIGRLGRNRVCAVYDPGVELPSDYSGVLR